MMRCLSSELVRETYSHKWSKDFCIPSVCVELRHNCINLNGSSHPIYRVGGTGASFHRLRIWASERKEK